jgi:NADH-quinone oxidoreductase subunit A
MLAPYLPILILLLVVLAFVGVSIGLSQVLGPRRKSRGKGDTYECGMTPEGSARGRLSVKFFVVAVLFILFDIETVFLIPWAVNLRALTEQGAGPFLFVEMMGFLAILVLGLVYVWRKGGLAWD